MPRPMADLKTVESLVEALEGAMDIQNELKAQVLKRVKDDLEDMDEQQKEDFEEDYEEINDIMQIAKDVLEEVLKKYNALEQRVSQKMGLMYMNVFKKKFASQKEKVYAVCFFDYLLEYCTDALFAQAYGMVLPPFQGLFEDLADPELNQALAYGLGVFFKRASQQQAQNWVPALKAYLMNLVNHKEALSEAFKESTDTAVHALGKCALFQN